MLNDPSKTGTSGQPRPGCPLFKPCQRTGSVDSHVYADSISQLFLQIVCSSCSSNASSNDCNPVWFCIAALYSTAQQARACQVTQGRLQHRAALGTLHVYLKNDKRSSTLARICTEPFSSHLILLAELAHSIFISRSVCVSEWTTQADLQLATGCNIRGMNIFRTVSQPLGLFGEWNFERGSMGLKLLQPNV